VTAVHRTVTARPKSRQLAELTDLTSHWRRELVVFLSLSVKNMAGHASTGANAQEEVSPAHRLGPLKGGPPILVGESRPQRHSEDRYRESLSANR
jgi:hypothetical protein